MILYNVNRNEAALSTTNDYMTLISAAARSFIITEFEGQGNGTASADNMVGLYRVSSAGTTGATAVTPTAVDSPASALTFQGLVWTAWTTQPTVGALIQQHGINANGQRCFWRANPNMSNAITVPGGNNAAGTVSVRSISGTGTVSIRLQIAEF